MRKKNSLKFIISAFCAAALFTCCDQYDADVPPPITNKLAIHNDYVQTQKNRGLTINVLANDTISANAILQFEQPANGTLTADAGNHIFYQPRYNFTGRDSLTYVACIGPACATATVFIQVLPDSGTTCVLKAVNDSVSIAQNRSSVTVDILNNDTFCNAKPAISLLPHHGQVYINSAGQLIYLPANGYLGTDYLEYELIYQGTRVQAGVYIMIWPDQVTSITRTNPE